MTPPRKIMKKRHISSAQGIDVIAKKVKSLQNKPGVYQIKDSQGKVLYVGKAKNLKKRVKSYLNQKQLSVRIQRMVALIESIEKIATNLNLIHI